MWGKQEEQKAPAPAPSAVVPPAPEPPRSVAFQPVEQVTAAGQVSKGISIKGEISGKENLFIDGEVQGSIRLTSGSVTVGPNGRVTADIEADEVVVRGKVKGALRGRERVQIGQTAEVTGDVATRRISIEEGAMFHGNIEIVRAENARNSRTTTAAAASAGSEGLRPVTLNVKTPQS